MKREFRYRRTVATAVAILILLGTPVYGRARKDREPNQSPKTVIQRLVTWVQTRIVPPWPEPDPTTTSGVTSTDVVTTTT